MAASSTRLFNSLLMRGAVASNDLSTLPMIQRLPDGLIRTAITTPVEWHHEGVHPELW